jgi:hypothetical protein
MDKAELLSTLNGLVDKYEQHRQYIEKARAQAAKFSSGVVEKVILDHEIKSQDLADGVNPLLPELRALVAGFDAEKAAIVASKGGVDEQIQELELRQMIGEITDGEFETQVGDLRSNAASANERIDGIDGSLAELNGAIERWSKLASPQGHFTVAEPEAVMEDDSVYHGASEAEDVSSVFADEPSVAAVRVSEAGEEIAIETGEVGEDAGDAASAEIQFSTGGEDGPVAGEVEIEIGMGEPVAAEVAADGDDAKGDADGTARRALLIYQESTAEEQIYPFTNDQLTIGRGRENDIQIKNDSKVSRYHCKLFRRGNNFYVEDIKSSNGTLVNGELITDRRLFGGEEIVVGETYFRFRIME